VTDVSQLPSLPYNAIPITLGTANGDEPRLAIFNYYLYSEGIYKGAEAWVTGSAVDAFFDGGQLTEILSTASKHVHAVDAPAPPPADEVDEAAEVDEVDPAAAAVAAAVAAAAKEKS
jgi:hypothetical protein